VAGLDFDHEGLTMTPWGDRPVNIRGLRLHGVSVDLNISGQGTHIGSLKLNGKRLPAGLRKMGWKDFKGKTVRLELVRSEKAPQVPVIVRADGLRVTLLESRAGGLTARVGGDMSGEVVVQTKANAQISIDGKPAKYPFDSSTGTISIPFPNQGDLKLDVTP